MRLSPLDIALVLEKVFEQLPAKDKKNFRVVNKSWRDASLEKWRTTMEFQILKKQDEKKNGINKFFNLFHGSEWEASVNVAEPFFRFDDLPFRQFYLDDRCIYLPPFQTIPQFEDEAPPAIPNPRTFFFFDRYGHNITSLRLGNSVKFWKNGFLEGMKWIFRTCPNLTEISVSPNLSRTELPVIQQENDNNLGQQTADAVKYLQILSSVRKYSRYLSEIEGSAAELFNLVPNVEVLSLNVESGGFLRFLKTPLRNGKHIKLHRLEVVVGQERLEMLREYVEAAKPPLSNLKLYVDLEYDIRERPLCMFHRLLVDIKETLKKLTLIFNVYKEETMWMSDLTGHHFPHVTYLFIKANIKVWEDIYCSDIPPQLRFDFRCLGGFPKLQKLHYVVGDSNRNQYEKNIRLRKEQMYFKGNLQWNDRNLDVRMPPTTIPLKDLKEFFFFHMEHFDPVCLRVLAQWMPSVKKLSIIADKETFPLVLDLWKLDKLTLLPVSYVSEASIQRRLRGKQIKIESIGGKAIEDYLSKF